MANGLMIDYQYCTGCHACEVACSNEHGFPQGRWGIKLMEVGPFKTGIDSWEWNFIPAPTSLCDLCEERVAEGKDPTCVHHCLGQCMEYGPVEELAKKMTEKGAKVTLFMP